MCVCVCVCEQLAYGRSVTVERWGIERAPSRSLVQWPVPCLLCSFHSSIHHLSYDDCLESKSENNQNCSVLCCVRQLCRVIRAHV